MLQTIIWRNLYRSIDKEAWFWKLVEAAALAKKSNFLVRVNDPRGIFKVQLGWYLPLDCSLGTLFKGKEFYFSLYDESSRG
jgi:hypothetical protein